jgi:hypothetical protein
MTHGDVVCGVGRSKGTRVQSDGTALGCFPIMEYWHDDRLRYEYEVRERLQVLAACLKRLAK